MGGLSVSENKAKGVEYYRCQTCRKDKMVIARGVQNKWESDGKDICRRCLTFKPKGFDPFLEIKKYGRLI